MRQPHGRPIINGKNGRPMLPKLNKAIFGLKHDGREWWLNITKFLTGLGFSISVSDPCIFIQPDIIVAVYVGDIVIGGANIKVINEFKADINKRHDMKEIGPVEWLLGVKVDRTSDSSMNLSQGAYSQQIIDRYGMRKNGLATLLML